MRITLSITLGCCLALAGAARADEVVSLAPPLVASSMPESSALTDAHVSGGGHGLPRFWAEADYLLVSAKAAPTPPLLTSGSSAVLGPNGFPGTLGGVGTTTVLGGSNLAFNPASGLRLTAGAWLNDDACYGLESSYFRVQERTELRSASSPGTPGSAPLAVPYFNAALQQESSVAIAFDQAVNPIAGGALLSVTTRIQGFELNGSCRLYEGSTPYLGARLDLLFGYRWIGLDENLYFDTASNVVGQANTFRTSDSFLCSNDFHGAQIGLREQVYFRRVYLRGTAKIAFGSMHQLTRADGSLLTGDFPGLAGNPQRFNGGYLVLPSNAGRSATDRFAWVPEATVGGGWHVCEWLRLNVSYTFLYLSTVARPGDQIDRVINPTQGPAYTGDPNAALQGPARPTYQGRSNEYWMQGVSVGAEVRF